ncbi:MAG: glycosyltransferase family 39 protein [Candidatus Poribacteria bacterium]
MQTPNLILALLQWGVANLFVMGLAALLWQSLRLNCQRMNFLVYGFLFIFITTLLVMLFGLVGWLYRTPIFLISLLGCIAIGWAWRSGKIRIDSVDTDFRTLSILSQVRRRYLLNLFFFVLIALQLIRMGIHVWFLPPYVWDTLTYHLPNVAEWIQNHRLLIFDTPVKRSFWPANYELFQTWFVLFPHHDFMIDAASIPFYLLASACVYSIARTLNINHPLALFTAILYAYSPSIAIHATSGNNDLPIAAVYLFILALLLDWQQSGTHLRKRLLLIWLGLCLAIGTKPYIAFIVPGLFVFAIWSLWKRTQIWTESPVQEELSTWRSKLKIAISKNSTPKQILLICFVTAAGSLIAGYWFIRNLILFDNPFYPTDLRLFGHLIFGAGEGHGQQGTFSFASLAKNVEMLIGKKIYDSQGTYNADLNDITGWGWFAFCCGLPTLVYGIITVAQVRWLAGGFLLSLAGLLAWVTPDPWNMRFTLWFPALFSLSFGLVVSRLRPKPIRWGFYFLATGCLILNFVGTLDIGRLNPKQWEQMARLPLKKRSTAALGLYIGESYQNALETVPPDEIIGYNVSGDGWVYPLYAADFSRKLRYVPIDANTDILEIMRQRNVSYLFVSRPPPLVQQKIEEAVTAGGLESIGEGLYVRKD